MTWMMSNVVVRVSKITGLKHPTKEREENKIDGPVASPAGARSLDGQRHAATPRIYVL